MARREGCEDYVSSQDFLEPMPGDNPQAIGDFVKAAREGIEAAKLAYAWGSCPYCGATGDWLDSSCEESGWPCCRYCKGV